MKGSVKVHKRRKINLLALLACIMYVHLAYIGLLFHRCE